MTSITVFAKQRGKRNELQKHTWSDLASGKTSGADMTFKYDTPLYDAEYNAWESEKEEGSASVLWIVSWKDEAGTEYISDSEKGPFFDVLEKAVANIAPTVVKLALPIDILSKPLSDVVSNALKVEDPIFNEQLATYFARYPLDASDDGDVVTVKVGSKDKGLIISAPSADGQAVLIQKGVETVSYRAITDEDRKKEQENRKKIYEKGLALFKEELDKLNKESVTTKK